MKGECRWCGPVWVADDFPIAIDQLTEHAISESHLTMVRLNIELDAFVAEESVKRFRNK